MKSLIFLCLCFGLSNTCQAQKDLKSAIFSNAKGAIKGYDPVAYFTQNQPVKGSESITFDWMGETWHFATQANRALFIEHPDQYAPQYGGYCAYGWAKGYAAKTEPDAWTIVDGKLYLNYDKGVQSKWEKDIPGYVRQADSLYLKNKRTGRN